MSKFLVKPTQLIKSENDFQTIQKQLAAHADSISGIRQHLNIESDSSPAIQQALYACETSLSQQAQYSQSLQNGLSLCDAAYLDTEKQLCGSSSKTASAKNSTKGKTKKNKKSSVNIWKLFLGAAVESTTDLLSGFITIIKMPYDLITKGKTAFANDGWKLINSVFKSGQDLSAMALILIGMLGKKESDWRTQAIAQADAYKQMGSLADQFASYRDGSGDFFDRMYTGLEKGARTADLASNAYSAYNSAKSLVTDTSDLITDISTKHEIELDIFGEFGFDTDTAVKDIWTDSFSKSYGYDMLLKANSLDNMKTAIDYSKSIADGTLFEEIWNNTTIGGLFTDTPSKIADNVVKLLS